MQIHNSIDVSDSRLEYWIEHVSFGLIYVMFTLLLGYSTGEFQALQQIFLFLEI